MVHVQSAAFNLQEQPLQEWFVHYDTFVCMTSFQTHIDGKTWEKNNTAPFEQTLVQCYSILIAQKLVVYIYIYIYTI